MQQTAGKIVLNAPAEWLRLDIYSYFYTFDGISDSLRLNFRTKNYHLCNTQNFLHNYMEDPATNIDHTYFDSKFC